MKEIIKNLREARTKTELLILQKDIEKQLDDLEKKELEIQCREDDLNEDALQTSSLVEYRSQSYASFYNTKLEKDKSILTISVAGLGFLITFINLSKLDVYAYIFLFLSSMSFMFCIYAVIKILDKNADYIISVVTDNDDFSDKELYLRKLDKRCIKSFYLGVFFAFCLGVYMSYLNNSTILIQEPQKSIQSSKIDNNQ